MTADWRELDEAIRQARAHNRRYRRRVEPEPRKFPPKLRDQVTGEHQILVLSRGGLLAVSCPCLRVPGRGRPAHTDIEARAVFPAAAALAAWRGWHEENGVTV